MATDTHLLQVENLQTAVHLNERPYLVVDHVSLDLKASETVALVGESGSGKSMTALSIARLLHRNLTIVGGRILLGGQDLLSLSDKQMREYRAREISVVFQEPMTSLNPVLTVGTQVAESVRRRVTGKADVQAHSLALLESVGIPDPERRLKMYPHQFSGGMRQRIMMAIAIAAHPRVLIADEPTTALDVTTQAQILDLMQAKMNEMGTSTLLITHDMGVVARYAQRVNVMYSGLIVERAAVHDIFGQPAHPYTRGLLMSMPRLDRPRIARLPAIEGLPPVVFERPKGCPFQSRCHFRIPRCAERPPLVDISPKHAVACWRADEVAAVSVEDWANLTSSERALS